MRLVLYGFGPYRQFRDNITAKIICSLPKRPGLNTVVFPVRFQRRQFIEAIERYRADCILGLGQSTRRRIDIESRARNWRSDASTRPGRAIIKGKPEWLLTTLELKSGRQAARSDNAGDFVCNYSMYVMLDHIASRKLDIPLGFIHIPFNCDRRKAQRFVQNILRQCYALADRINAEKINAHFVSARKA
jgi:pyroglutamyl-peptidase